MIVKSQVKSNKQQVFKSSLRFKPKECLAKPQTKLKFNLNKEKKKTKPSKVHRSPTLHKSGPQLHVSFAYRDQQPLGYIH